VTWKVISNDSGTEESAWLSLMCGDEREGQNPPGATSEGQNPPSPVEAAAVEAAEYDRNPPEEPGSDMEDL